MRSLRFDCGWNQESCVFSRAAFVLNNEGWMTIPARAQIRCWFDVCWAVSYAVTQSRSHAGSATGELAAGR